MEEGSAKIRPTKKQHDLLVFIENFIAEQGYSPSYREIMQGVGYNSVATVALHVNNLITRGHLHKRDRSARSLEVIKASQMPAAEAKVVTKQLKTSEAKWLIEKVEAFFKEIEAAPAALERDIDRLYVLIGSLKVLGLDGAANSYIPRLTAIKKRAKTSEYIA